MRPFRFIEILVVIAGAGLVVALTWRYAGAPGVGLLGLLVGFLAQRIDLERAGAVGHPMNTDLFASQFRARERMTRAERAEHEAEMKRLEAPLHWAKVSSAGLIILGFGLWILGP